MRLAAAGGVGAGRHRLVPKAGRMGGNKRYKDGPGEKIQSVVTNLMDETER